jgi:biopolymer transport protein TolQ
VGPLSYITYSALEAMERMLQMEGYQHYALTQQGTLPRQLTDAEIDKLRTQMNNAMSNQEMELEDKMSLISCLASLAPMCGLFGTVWGVMGTFIGIVANGGRPDIQAIAPGISGALLTTVAGLVVAIPAIAMNYWIVSIIQRIEISMQTYIEEFISSIRLCKVTSPAPQQNPAPRPPAGGQASPYRQPQEPYRAQQPQAPYQPPVLHAGMDDDTPAQNNYNQFR